MRNDSDSLGSDSNFSREVGAGDLFVSDTADKMGILILQMEDGSWAFIDRSVRNPRVVEDLSNICFSCD